MIRSNRLKKEQKRMTSAVNRISKSAKIPVRAVYILIVLLIAFSVFVGILLKNQLISIILIVGTVMLVIEVLNFNQKRDLKKIESDLAYLSTKISNHFDQNNDVLKALNDNRKKTPNEKLSDTLNTIVYEVNVLNYTLQDALERQSKEIDSRLWQDFIKVLKSCDIDNEMRHALTSLTVEMDEIKSNQNLYDAHRALAWREYGNVVLMTIFIFFFLGVSLKEVASHIFNSKIGMLSFSIFIASIFATMIYNLRQYKPLSEVGRRSKK